MSRMTIKKKVILAAILVVLSLFLLAALYIMFVRPRPSKGNSELIKAIPADAVLILQCTHPQIFLKELGETAYWKDLSTFGFFRSSVYTLPVIDSAIRSHPRLMDFLDEYPSAISLHLNDKGKPGILFLFELPSMFHRKTIRGFMDDFIADGADTSLRYRGKVVNNIQSHRDSLTIFYTFVRGLFLACNDSALIYKAIDHLADGGMTIWNDPCFQKVSSTTGRMVYVHAFINNRVLCKNLPGLLDTNTWDSLSGFSWPSGWSAFDLVIKQNEMILNGFTALDDTSGGFYQICQRSLPQAVMIHQVLPHNTFFSIQAGIEQFGDYLNKLKKYGGANDTFLAQTVHSLAEPTLLLDMDKRMESIAGPEICIAFTGPFGSSLANNAYLIIRNPEAVTSQVSLDLLSDPSPKNIFQVEGATIRKLILPNPYKIIFGPLARENAFECYTILDDHIVFGHSFSSIRKYITFYRSGRILGKTDMYSEYLDNFPERSNLVININLRNAGEAALTILNDSLAEMIRQQKDFFNRFDGLSLQFSAMGGLLYTNIHFNYCPGFVEESPYLWKTILDTTIQNGPFIVRNPYTNSSNIVVFDNMNQMILLDEKGTIQWKVMLSGPVLSQVYEVDLNRARRSQLIFNTADYLYLIDFNGRPAGDYPVALDPKATNGITVLDYERDKDYRIIMACDDRKIYNFDIQGNPVKGWNIPQTDSQVTFPLQHLRVSGKDYLIFTSEDGQVLMTDRKGAPRKLIDKEFINSTRSDFSLVKPASNGTMITTDIYGNVIYLAPSGKIRKESFGDFLPDHYFVSADFNNDRSDDFIFLDSDILTIFDQKKKKIYEYTFDETVDHKPLLFAVPGSGTYLGFHTSSSGSVILINKDGQAIWAEGIKSDRPFLVGHVANKETYQIVTGYKNEVMTYLFE